MMKFTRSVTLLVAMVIAIPAFAGGDKAKGDCPKTAKVKTEEEAKPSDEVPKSAEEAQSQINMKALWAYERVAKLKQENLRLRKLIASLTRIQRQGREGLQKQIDELEGKATVTSSEIAHQCASFGSEKERELCLGIEVKQVENQGAASNAKYQFLTSIVGKERCKMHVQAEVSDGEKSSKKWVWKCQPANAESAVRSHRFTEKTESMTASGFTSTTTTYSNESEGGSDSTTPPAQLPAYPVVAPTRPTRWGLVVGAGLLGGAVGAGVGYATGNPAQLHHGLNGPTEYRPGTQTKRAIGGAAIGAIVTAGLTWVVDRLTSD